MVSMGQLDQIRLDKSIDKSKHELGKNSQHLNSQCNHPSQNTKEGIKCVKTPGLTFEQSWYIPHNHERFAQRGLFRIDAKDEHYCLLTFGQKGQAQW